MILGLIEMKCNFYLTEKTTNPLHHMAQALLDLPAKIKLVTASCRETHTANNLMEPGRVCQLTLGCILNLYKQSGRDSLGCWSWQEFHIDGPCTLYVITAYRVCPWPPTSSKFGTAWHQQYRGLVKKGLHNPDPRQRFLVDLRKFLDEIKSSGSEYIVGWDANTPHDDDEILDFLQDTDMIDALMTSLMNALWPISMDQNRSTSSIALLPLLMMPSYSIPSKYGKGDHSYIGIDLDFGLLKSHDDLSDIDPGHCQNWTLVSTNVKASQS